MCLKWKDYIVCESFTVLCNDSLFVYKNKYYLKVYLDICTYKIAGKQIMVYLEQNLFED